MGANTKIEWAHHTFNPWRGCTKVSAGCDHCYAEAMSKRNPKVLGVWGPEGARAVAADAYWAKPLTWNAAAKAAGERHRVFCASLADVFEGPETMPAEAWPVVEAARLRLFELIGSTIHLDWLLLTKRPENVLRFLPATWGGSVLLNIWIGTSVEDQAAADERIPHLLEVPARVRFLSCEPLLGPVDISPWLGRCPSCGTPPGAYVSCSYCEAYPDARGLQWVIAGGESGPKARAPHPEWFMSLRDQCQAAGVAFHFKQWGEFSSISPVGPGETYPDSSRLVSPHDPHRPLTAGIHHGSVYMHRAGKAHAGRLLDGREWNEVPE